MDSINNTHSFQIEKLMSSFTCILDIVKNTENIQKIAHTKLNRLKTTYTEMIRNNNKKNFLFCLDSFYFQYKTFQLEYDNLEKSLKFINNRIYCDYYKLIMIITNNAKHNIIDLGNYEHRDYVPYRDLEPFYEYQINDIKDIHSDILNTIRILFQQYSNRQISIENYNQSHDIGFTISNFINTLQFENRNLNEQIMLYVNYIAFFHISQKQYLQRIYAKFEEFYKDVENNICRNQSFSIDDINVEHAFNVETGDDTSNPDIDGNEADHEDEDIVGDKDETQECAEGEENDGDTVEGTTKDKGTTNDKVVSILKKTEDNVTVITSKINNLNAKIAVTPLPNSKKWDIINQTNI